MSESDIGVCYGCSGKNDGTMLVAVNGEIFSPGQQNRENFFNEKKLNTGPCAVWRIAQIFRWLPWPTTIVLSIMLMIY